MSIFEEYGALNIWKQNTETEKTNGFWLDMVNQKKKKKIPFKLKHQPKRISISKWCKKDSRYYLFRCCIFN